MDAVAAAEVNQALTQQAVALSVLKAASNADQAIANILTQSAANIPVSAVRGTSVDIAA